MARKARLLLPNCPHHIVQRGHNRKAVFVSDEDYLFYLENLREGKRELEIRVYAWCLMTNHIHLIVEPGSKVETVSVMMKRIAGRQSAYVNKLEGRTGALWEGRFKASPIQRDSYLLACCRYVEMNPVRARMVNDVKSYKWSSHCYRIGIKKCDWLDTDPCFMALGETNVRRQQRYMKYVEEGIKSDEKVLLDEAVQRNQLTGTERFVDEIEKRYGLRIERRGKGRQRDGGK